MPSHVQSARSLALRVACLASLLLSAHRPRRGTQRRTRPPVPWVAAARSCSSACPKSPSPRPTQRLVFTCVTPGLITFSDRPCGPLPERREIERAARDREWQRRSVFGHAAAGPRIDQAALSSPAIATDPTAPRGAERPAGCQPLRHAVTTIDRQMRAGYSAREAPRLWERWREAKDRLREAGC